MILDLQDALRLEPNDKAVKEELDKLLSAIESVIIECFKNEIQLCRTVVFISFYYIIRRLQKM